MITLNLFCLLFKARLVRTNYFPKQNHSIPWHNFMCYCGIYCSKVSKRIKKWTVKRNEYIYSSG